MIRDSGIDILVSLNGYFGEARMGVFARRPVPIQVNYLGFPATLCAPYIDYIIADKVVIPEGEQRFYDEQVYLPDSYQANDDRGREMTATPSRAEAGLPDKAFVFCNFNNAYKLTPATFAGWMRILKQVQGSVLWLLDSTAPYPDNLRREAQAHGVAAERLIFAPDRPTAQHLARLQLADLSLDSLPYNAHTTASDALWAGLPLVTAKGTTFPGRVAASLLVAAGLPELIAEDAAQFEALAVRLANDPDALKALRDRLAKAKAGCALFDTDRIRKHGRKRLSPYVEELLAPAASRQASNNVPAEKWTSPPARKKTCYLHGQGPTQPDDDVAGFWLSMPTCFPPWRSWAACVCNWVTARKRRSCWPGRFRSFLWIPKHGRVMAWL